MSAYFFGGALEVTDGAVKKYYSLAGQSIAMRDGTGLQYFLTDHLGSVLAVLGSNGTLISEQRYLPFGQVREDVGSITQTDFGYTGQRDVAGLGLMDYKARFYSSALGRFIQPDSIIPGAASPQSWNRHSYSLNNPIKYSDPTGHSVACDPYEDDCHHEPTPSTSGGSSGEGGGGGDRRCHNDPDCRLKGHSEPLNVINITTHITSDFEARVGSGIVGGVIGLLTYYLLPESALIAFITGFVSGALSEELALPGNVEGDVMITANYSDPHHTFTCYGNTYNTTISKTTVYRNGEVIASSVSRQGYCMER